MDSDEERDAVMAAVSRSLSKPQPLATRTLFPTRRKYQLVRMKEMLSNALSGNRGRGLFSVATDPLRSAYSGSATNDSFATPLSMTPSTAGGGSDALLDAQRRALAQQGAKTASRKTSLAVGVD